MEIVIFGLFLLIQGKTIMNAKLESKLKKLLALAERGMGGEKDNANRMLSKILTKNGLSVSDLLGEERCTCWLRYKGKLEKRLLLQIVVSVTNDPEINVWENKKKRECIGPDLTSAEKVEVELLFRVYRKTLNEEIDVMFAAFVNKHGIFPKEKPDSSEKPVTRDDSEKNIRISLVMKGLQDVSVRKELACQK